MRSHSSCYHTGYSLTCAEYDHLRQLAGERCMLCGARTARLEIEHDHALGRWAVRGLVCRTCNQHLRAVDDGRLPQSPLVAAYLANSWHKTQTSSAVKAARMLPIVDCPRCGHPTALHANGRLYRHFSRATPRLDVVCLDVAA